MDSKKETTQYVRHILPGFLSPGEITRVESYSGGPDLFQFLFGLPVPCSSVGQASYLGAGIYFKIRGD
jgi:hypothetical protein